MMSLSEILDEIQDDKVDDNVEQIKPEDETALEEIRSIKTKTHGLGFKISAFDNKVVDKFNCLYSKVRLREVISGMVKVDRAIAQEAMATLPEVSPAMTSKLTSYPSTINRKLLDEIVFTGNDEVPAELEEVIREMLNEVNSSYSENEKMLDEIKISSELLRNLVKTKYEDGDKKSIVLFHNTSYDLLTTPLNILFGLDDTKLDYEKYSGVLGEKIRKLAYSEKVIQFANFLKDNCGGDVLENHSVLDMVNEIARVEVILNSSFENISRFKESATTYFERNEKTLTGWVSDLVNSLESVIKSCENFNNISESMEGEDGVVQMLYDFLNFLD